jgi:hypothetical protein
MNYEHDNLETALIRDSIFNSFEEYGVEGTEDAIKRAYSYKGLEKAKEKFLIEYRKILRGEN